MREDLYGFQARVFFEKAPGFLLFQTDIPGFGNGSAQVPGPCLRQRLYTGQVRRPQSAAAPEGPPDDGKERYEDDLIAYTWDKFLRSGEACWLARLPM